MPYTAFVEVRRLAFLGWFQNTSRLKCLSAKWQELWRFFAENRLSESWLVIRGFARLGLLMKILQTFVFIFLKKSRCKDTFFFEFLTGKRRKYFLRTNISSFYVFFRFKIALLLGCPRLTYNDQRLGAAAADTKRYAGYCRSCSHVIFCGVTAAVAPNRPLYAAHL